MLTRMSDLPDLFALLRKTSSEEALDFVVIGGHAVNAYGYTRTTLDADFMVCVEDATAWRDSLESLGYAWVGQTDAFARMEPPTDAPNLLPVDIMLVERQTLSRITAECRLLDFGDVKLPVPQPLHLIALKLHAMKNADRLKAGKDLPDILHLVRVCQLDTESPPFRSILERYANDEIRTLLEKHLR